MLHKKQLFMIFVVVESSYPVGLMPMLYNQMGRNRKWKIQDGDGELAAFMKPLFTINGRLIMN